MPESVTETKIEKSPLRIRDEPLLSSVYEGDDVDSEYELERRYLPARPLSIPELEKLSKGHTLEIRQGYLEALDDANEKYTFRLRVTNRSGNRETTLYQVARKLGIKNSKARVEQQLKITPEDTDDAEDFGYLWNTQVDPSHVIWKTRYYIPHTLPNGHECEIHYDIHHGERFQEFPRIEVEFKSEAANEDHQYVLDNGPAALPDWVGEDVSDDKKYGGRSLAKNGPPQ